MALQVTFQSEHDIAKIIDSLAECAERRRFEDDPVAERMLLRLSEIVEDALSTAVGPGPCWAERVEQARAQHAEVAEARRRQRRVVQTR